MIFGTVHGRSSRAGPDIHQERADCPRRGVVHDRLVGNRGQLRGTEDLTITTAATKSTLTTRIHQQVRGPALIAAGAAGYGAPSGDRREQPSVSSRARVPPDVPAGTLVP